MKRYLPVDGIFYVKVSNGVRACIKAEGSAFHNGDPPINN